MVSGHTNIQPICCKSCHRQFKWHNTKEYQGRLYHCRSKKNIEEALVEEKEEKTTLVVKDKKTGKSAKEETRKHPQMDFKMLQTLQSTLA